MMTLLLDSSQVQKLWHSSHYCLSNALELFEDTANIPNQALVYANLASLMRAHAETYGSLVSSKQEDKDEEEEEKAVYQQCQSYQRAITYYTKGKEILHRSSSHPGIWYSIESDLSSVYYALGRTIQERPLITASTLEEVKLLLKYMCYQVFECEVFSVSVRLSCCYLSHCNIQNLP